jgi:hypothetical protein
LTDFSLTSPKPHISNQQRVGAWSLYQARHSAGETGCTQQFQMTKWCEQISWEVAGLALLGAEAFDVQHSVHSWVWLLSIWEKST